MSVEDNSQEAQEAAKIAVKQAKQAGKNAGRAVRAVADPVVEEATDMASDAIEEVKRVNPKVLSYISGDLGMAFIALSAALFGGTIAVNKFRLAYEGRKHLVDSVEKVGDSQ